MDEVYDYCMLEVEIISCLPRGGPAWHMNAVCVTSTARGNIEKTCDQSAIEQRAQCRHRLLENNVHSPSPSHHHDCHPLP